MIVYLLKSILCLAILLLVYQVFLEKEKMHRFNRWYLLGSIVFACIVPLISFEVQSGSLPILRDNYFEILSSDDGVAAIAQVSAQKSIATPVDYTIPALLFVYGSITFILLTRFCRNIYLLISSAAKNKVVIYKNAKLVLLKEKVASHSFLSYIFISEEDYKDQAIEEELITHELTHVKEKHSWDVIFIELLQTVFWFNPLFVFYKKAIQLNHEYLADDAVIRSCNNVSAYQYLLLDKASCHCNTCLTSNFNYSVTKKRLVMMTRTTNRLRAISKQLTILPLFTLSVFVFSSKYIIAQEKTPPSPKTNQVQSKDISQLYFVKGVPYTEQGLSEADLTEYKALEEKYIVPNEKGFKGFSWDKITDTDKEKMEVMFKQMSVAQQRKSRVIFLPPLGAGKKNPPTEAQLEKWKDENLYGVWIGSKKIKNEELNKYKASDFSLYDASKLYPNARKNVKYLVQINLYTNKDFEKMNQERKGERHFMMALTHPIEQPKKS